MSFDDIIAWVEGVIAGVIQFIEDTLSALIDVLNQIFGAIWNALGAVFDFFKGLFQTLADFFKHLWEDYILPAIHGLVDLYNRIVAWIKGIIQPILNIINKIRAWYYLYVRKWILLAQEILSVVRVFLSALRLLGVKWAAQLDAAIAKIQGYLTDALQAISSTLNIATTWLQFISDPLGILRKDFFTTSAWSWMPQLRRMTNFGGNRSLSASEAQDTQDDGKMANGGAAILTTNADYSVSYSDASQRLNSSADLGWKSWGTTPK